MNAFNIQTLIPSSEDRELARLTCQTLTDAGSRPLRIRFGDNGATCECPDSIAKVLLEMMSAMGKGQSFAVLPMQSELTVQQAAEVLDVSVPYMKQLLDDEEIAARRDGVHRVVQLRDLLEYDRRNTLERTNVLAELVAEGQRLDMGY